MSIIDLHSHLMPGVDDGAADDDAARDGLARFAASGVRRLVATPHYRASLAEQRSAFRERMDELDRGWARLSALAAAEEVEVHRAAEVMLDTPEPDLSDPRLRIGGGASVLVEFPFMTVPPRSRAVIERLRGEGWQPVLAHPERYRGLDGALRIVASWRAAGAVLQVNGPSLLGRFGPDVQRTAWRLLEAGLVHCVCSDFHGRGSPRVREYGEAITRAGGPETARLLMQTNPACVLDGEAPLSVPGVRPPRPSLLDRLARLFH